MKCFFGISNFLEEISSLSHSVVFLYFFALITEEGFLKKVLAKNSFKSRLLDFFPLDFEEAYLRFPFEILLPNFHTHTHTLKCSPFAR